jgi:site-specific DNA-methyltransferase (adenine-specific)
MSAPYYADESVTLYHGDALDLLPGLSADAVITDPPYGVSFRGEQWDETVPDWLPLARGAAPVVIFTAAPLTMWDYPRPAWVACWARPASNSRAVTGGFNHWSPVLVYGDVKFPVDLISLHAIANATPKWIDHPSPKPERLMRWLVEHGSPQGGTVLDPFAGSGTTLLAAKYLGRKAVGIEREERYCEVIADRLTQGVLDFGGAA